MLWIVKNGDLKGEGHRLSEGAVIAVDMAKGNREAVEAIDTNRFGHKTGSLENKRLEHYFLEMEVEKL